MHQLASDLVQRCRLFILLLSLNKLSDNNYRNYKNDTPQPFLALFWDHPGEPVPEENFWTSLCKGKLTLADTLTIRLGATPSGLTSAHLHHPPHTTIKYIYVHQHNH